MSGNVCEWCNDWYGDYSAGAATNPQGPSSGTYRVSRGGSWVDNNKHCRSANRNYLDPVSLNDSYGVRIVENP